MIFRKQSKQENTKQPAFRTSAASLPIPDSQPPKQHLRLKQLPRRSLHRSKSQGKKERERGIKKDLKFRAISTVGSLSEGFHDSRAPAASLAPMSSAMVDFRSPLQNPNPSSEGQASCSTSIAGHNAFASFSQSSMAFPTDSSYHNLDADGGARGVKVASGTSRPRLIKLRRHLGSQSKPAVPAPAGSIDPGFNPFRPVAGVRDSGVQAGVAKMRDAGSKKDSNFNPFQPVASVSDRSDRSDGGRMGAMEGAADSGFEMFRPRAVVSDGPDQSGDGRAQGAGSGVNLVCNEFRTGGSVSYGSERVDGIGMQSMENRGDLNFNLQQPKAPVSYVSDGINNVKMQATKEWAGNLFKSSSLFCDGSNQANDGKMRPTESWSGSGTETPWPHAPVGSGLDDKTQTLRDQLYSWKPFTSQDVKGLDGSGGAKAESFGFRKSNDSGFKFGANPVADSSDWGNRLPAEMGELKIGNEVASSNINSSGFIFTAGGKASSSSSSDSNSNLGDSFVFGSSTEKKFGSDSGVQLADETMTSGLVDELTKLKVREKPREANESTKVKENFKFVFGCSNNVAGAFGETIDNICPSEMKKLNIRTGMDEGKVSGLSDDLRKLKTEETAEDDNHMHKMDKKFHFAFRSNKNVSSSSNQTTDVGETDASYSSAPKTVQDEKIVSGLPDEMKKLKLEGKPKDADLRYKMDEEIGFVFCSNKNVRSSTSRKMDVGRPDAGHSTASMFVEDENKVSGVTDEMRKLKIERKIKDPSQSSKLDENVAFVFGSNKNDSNNVDFVFGSIKNVPRSLGGSMDTAGNDMSCSTSTAALQNERGASGLPGGVRKLRVEKNAQDTSLGSKLDEKIDFVSGINKTIPEKSSGNGTGHSSFATSMEDAHFRNSGYGVFSGSTVGSASVPESFSFQSGFQGNCLGMGQIPSNELQGDPSLLSSTGPIYQSAENRSTANQSDKKPEFYFRSTQQVVETSQSDLKTNQNADSSTDTLFAGLHQNLEFSAKRGTVKSVRSKKKRGKMKPTQQGEIHFISSERSSQENSEAGSAGSYSPMDFSPYNEEISSVDQLSRETSVASDQSLPFATTHESKTTKESGYANAKDEDLLNVTQYLNTAENDMESGELSSEGSKHNIDGYSGLNCLPPGKENNIISNDINIDMSEKGGGKVFCFSSSSRDASETNFTFAATQPTLSEVKRLYRKKNRGKVVAPDSYPSTPDAQVGLASPSSQFFSLSSSLHPGPSESQNGVVAVPQNVADKEQEIRKESIATIPANTAAEEACEKWRLRGNQAYASGDLSKAEECYTRGVSCASPKETTRSCIRALMLCYSNRAATRMSLGRMREALGDCLTAASLDPNFTRVQVRAANCYLALGDIKEALKHFKKCLRAVEEGGLDKKIRTEASDGLQKAQLMRQVAEFMDSSAELLCQRTSKDAVNALQNITEALSISPYSDNLLEMKAEALLLLRKYEEVVQLCEQTMESAERNSAVSSDDGELKIEDGSVSVNNSTERLWRWRLMSKSYFYMGRLEESLDLLQRHEKVGPLVENFNVIILVIFTWDDKAAGNEAFQAGRHSEAVEHYTAAIACSVESRPFAAICFCNRAAAYQALGQITEAIADCSLAIALDASYPKGLGVAATVKLLLIPVIRFKATLHEMIRDYGQAMNDLQRLISLLEKQIEDKPNQAGTSGRSNTSVNDLRQARMRLAIVEEEAKKEIPMDMYLIFQCCESDRGIEASSSASDIKKAYRKAALRHHPDKAGQFLARTENGDESVRKEVVEEVHKDADRLFKMIGEAYAVISDPTKRLRYDADEEIRQAQKKGNGNTTPRSPRDVYNYPSEQGRWRWQDTWKYGNAQKRWSEMPRSHSKQASKQAAACDADTGKRKNIGICKSSASSLLRSLQQCGSRDASNLPAGLTRCLSTEAEALFGYEMDEPYANDGKLMEKDAALHLALSRLSGDFNKESMLSLRRFFASRHAPVISTGSLKLDLALGVGGLPKGRMVEIYGQEASGKTTLALHIVKEAQKNGGARATTGHVFFLFTLGLGAFLLHGRSTRVLGRLKFTLNGGHGEQQQHEEMQK
ncbi:hypothetical protein ACLOJK_000386 [Asimina triloba]